VSSEASVPWFLNLRAAARHQMVSATASGIGQLEVAGRGRSNFREWSGPTPREKALFQNKARRAGKI
jgi:hypothetical protein